MKQKYSSGILKVCSGIDTINQNLIMNLHMTPGVLEFLLHHGSLDKKIIIQNK